MKGFTLIEILVALLMSSFLLLIVNKSYFIVTNSLQRNVSPEVALLSEGLMQQLKYLSKKEFIYEGKKTKPFFIWNEKRLAFITEWSSAGSIIVCYHRGKKTWQYLETLLTDNKIPENYCEGQGIFLPRINFKINSEKEEISEITPGQHGSFTLQIKSLSYIRKLQFKL